jgi:hypothetical protein
MKSLFKLPIEFCILIIGGITFIILFIIGIIYTILKHLIKLNYSPNKQFQPIIRSITLALDGLACAGGGELLNDILKINGKIKYGNWNQTISAVTGLILIYEKDTRLRIFLDKVLGKNHCTEAISQQDKFYYKNNQT